MLTYVYVDENGYPVAPKVNSDGTLPTSGGSKVTDFSTDKTLTSSTGTAWVVLPPGTCTQLTVINQSSVEISYRKVGALVTFSLPAYSSVLLPTIANSNEWEVQRVDQGTEQVEISILRVVGGQTASPVGDYDAITVNNVVGQISLPVNAAQNTTLIEVRDRLGLKPYPAFPDRIHTIHDFVTVSGITPSTNDENLREIDWNSPAFQGVSAIYLTGLVMNNPTPPGALRTITLVGYWSDIQMGNINNAPIQLEFRKTVFGTITLANSGSAVRYYKFGGIIIPESRYLYIATTRSQQNAGSSVSLTTWAVGVLS